MLIVLILPVIFFKDDVTLLAPLHIAVSRGLSDTVKALISAGADVNIVGADDIMPLLCAHQLQSNNSVTSEETIATIIQSLTER